MSQIKLTADSGGGTTSLKAPSSTTSNADVVLKLPIADGSANQVLKTDGSGQLSFTSNTANTLEGEANVTYNGTRLEVKTGDLAVTGAEGGDAQLRLTADEGDDGADYWRLESKASNNKFNLATYASGAWVDKLSMDTNGSTALTGGLSINGAGNNNASGQDAALYVTTDVSDWGVIVEKSTEYGVKIDIANNTTLAFALYNGVTQKLAVAGDGKITATNNLAFASGKGIDFSATSDAGGMTSELLDNYEEGTFTPTSSAVTLTGTIAGHYTKIGDLVTVQCIFVVPVTSNSSDIEINGLPFNAKNGTDGSFIQGGCVTYHNQGGGPYTVLLANNNNQLVVYKADGNRQTFNQFSNANLRMMATYKVA